MTNLSDQLDAIIISDLHLGSFVCQAPLILAFLEKIKSKEIDTKRLILNGDVFDSWNFTRLHKNHWKILSAIRKLSDKIEIIWCAGNHDGPSEIVSHLLGVDVEDEYVFESGGKYVLVLHGDKFDKFIVEHPIMTAIADFFYSILQKIDKSFWMAKQAKQRSKTFLRCSEIVMLEAVEYMKEQGCDKVCCGHVHVGKEGFEYFNSGSWTETPCHYLVVNAGKIELKEFA